MGQPRHDALGNQQPFVHHPIEPHLAFFQQGGNLGRAPQAAHLFVRAKGQVNGALRFEVAGRQQLNRLQLGDQVAFVVPGATAPDEAVFDHAGERLLRPIFLSPWRHRHHVLVRHQEQRLGIGLAAGPGVEQAQAPHHFALKHAVRLGKTRLQQAVQLQELVATEGCVIAR